MASASLCYFFNLFYSFHFFFFFCTPAASKGNWRRDSSESISQLVNAQECQLALAPDCRGIAFLIQTCSSSVGGGPAEAMVPTPAPGLNVELGVSLFDPPPQNMNGAGVNLINYLRPLFLRFLFVGSCGCNLL